MPEIYVEIESVAIYYPVMTPGFEPAYQVDDETYKRWQQTMKAWDKMQHELQELGERHA